ncbi:DUF1275 domain-containing protein [Flavobacterium johnsoniae]|uniref:YoaK family protein n=1 Tax=Flavobacterium johnsoniae TaxID=986 RepID=UPI0025B13A11|nr:YoaK family protein [Flavobacterium johnsoniae]WJS93360.1 DUF1275 domain-containing protein [Flavobacterium johnsoniae]
MFKHKGKKRNLKHNLKIASLLSFVAGMVNVAGFFSVKTLTTNVTGHFAFFVDEIFKLDFFTAFIYFGYIFSFFMGSFTSSLLMELVVRRRENIVHLIPASIEIVILFFIAIFGDDLIVSFPNLISFTLLYAMGMQNSFVTRISNSIVRTTHLTGLFTDLGIELSQLFFYREQNMKAELFSSIKLRITIISYFFIGGIVGAVFYSNMGLQVLFLAGFVLLGGLIYDNIKLNLILLKRKLKNRK